MRERERENGNDSHKAHGNRGLLYQDVHEHQRKCPTIASIYRCKYYSKVGGNCNFLFFLVINLFFKIKLKIFIII